MCCWFTGVDSALSDQECGQSLLRLGERQKCRFCVNVRYRTFRPENEDIHPCIYHGKTLFKKTLHISPSFEKLQKITSKSIAVFVHLCNLTEDLGYNKISLSSMDIRQGFFVVSAGVKSGTYKIQGNVINGGADE